MRITCEIEFGTYLLERRKEFEGNSSFAVQRKGRVPTFRFNEAVKRNRRRFPDDFMFQLTSEELSALTSQIAISKTGRRTAALPYAFTEHGATTYKRNIVKAQP